MNDLIIIVKRLLSITLTLFNFVDFFFGGTYWCEARKQTLSASRMPAINSLTEYSTCAELNGRVVWVAIERTPLESLFHTPLDTVPQTKQSRLDSHFDGYSILFAPTVGQINRSSSKTQIVRRGWELDLLCWKSFAPEEWSSDNDPVASRWWWSTTN